MDGGKQSFCDEQKHGVFFNYLINIPIKKVYEQFDPEFCKGDAPTPPGMFGKNNLGINKKREEVFVSAQQKLMDYIFLVLSIIYFLVMHFYFKTIFVRTPEQRAEYDKDTKEKSYSFLRLIHVLLKNSEQYSIPTSLLIYVTAFIAFIFYKLSVLTSDGGDEGGNTQVKPDELIENLKKHFKRANSNGANGANGADEPSTLFTFLTFFAYIVIILYVCASLLLYIIKFVIKLQSFTSTFLFFTNILIVMLFIGIALKIGERRFEFISNILGIQQLKLILRILKKTVFYIPCLITDIFANITNTAKNTKKMVVMVLLVEIGLILLNTIVPVIDKLMAKHLGSVILRKPVYLNNDHHYGDNKYQHGSLVLNSKKDILYKTQSEDYGLFNEGKPTPGLAYKDLNILGHLDPLKIFGDNSKVDETEVVYKNEERSKYDHNYALSFWYYINPMNENISKSYNDDTLMINFANRPRIEYNHSENKIKIIMRSGPFTDMSVDNKDESYTNTEIQLQNVRLQKWNHLVINYTSGVLDIFMDGELVESRQNVKPLMQEGSILSGQEDGINGRISNVAYYNKPLSKILIDFLYNTNKDKETPLGGGILTNMYFLINMETTVVESILRPIVDILAEITPKKLSFAWVYNYILDLPDTIHTNFWYVLDRFLFDYYQEDDNGYISNEKKNNKTPFDIDLEYRQNYFT